jgi:hypothetical protein
MKNQLYQYIDWYNGKVILANCPFEITEKNKNTPIVQWDQFDLPVIELIKNKLKSLFDLEYQKILKSIKSHVKSELDNCNNKMQYLKNRIQITKAILFSNIDHLTIEQEYYNFVGKVSIPVNSYHRMKSYLQDHLLDGKTCYYEFMLPKMKDSITPEVYIHVLFDLISWLKSQKETIQNFSNSKFPTITMVHFYHYLVKTGIKQTAEEKHLEYINNGLKIGKNQLIEQIALELNVNPNSFKSYYYKIIEPKAKESGKIMKMKKEVKILLAKLLENYPEAKKLFDSDMEKQDRFE